jgi:chaperone modulatory protein CbpM
MSVRRTSPRASDEIAVGHAIELTVVARQAGVQISLARRYLAFGLFEACAGTSDAPLFEPICAARLAKAERLRRDLSLNYAGAVLVCELLDRIEELEAVSRR